MSQPKEQLGFKPHESEDEPLIGEMERAQKLAEEARVRAQIEAHTKPKKKVTAQEDDGGGGVGVK